MHESDKNIVLIGMMGSGKTTIGKIISDKLHMNFVDMDEYIEEQEGSSISEIFKSGEEHFRSIENEAAAKLSNIKHAVISTGGGIIKEKSNIEFLKKSGITFFIDRPIENIASDIEADKRPLLNGGREKLFHIFNDRYELYKRYSDIIIKNDKDIDRAADDIIKIYLSKASSKK